MKPAFNALWGEINRHPVKTARRLFPARMPGYVSATNDLACLAINRSAYDSCKARGDKSGAQVYLSTLTAIAESLPLFVSRETAEYYGSLWATWRVFRGTTRVGESWYATWEQANAAALEINPQWFGSDLSIKAGV